MTIYKKTTIFGKFTYTKELEPGSSLSLVPISGSPHSPFFSERVTVESDRVVIHRLAGDARLVSNSPQITPLGGERINESELERKGLLSAMGVVRTRVVFRDTKRSK